MVTPAEWLDLIARKVPALRAAGVLRIQFEGCTVDIAPLPAIAEGEVATSVPVLDYGDPLDDPDTFGGKVPTLRRQREDA